MYKFEKLSKEEYIESSKNDFDIFMQEVDPQNKLNKIEDLILEFEKNFNISLFETVANIKKILGV